MNKKITLGLFIFLSLSCLAQPKKPQNINEGTTGAGIFGGLIVGGVTAAAARNPYGLLAAPAGALIGVLIKRHINKKRIERAQRNTNSQNQQTIF